MPVAPGARFSDPAELYDLVHQWKPYAAEAQRLGELLTGLGVPEGGSVLEGACGTGTYLVHLASRFRVQGFDLSASMLRVARAKLPHATLFQADLLDFRVDPAHDAVLVLFGGLAYVPPAHLAQACESLALATRPGGAVIIEPWLEPDRFVADEPHMAVFDSHWLKVCRQCVTRREGDVAHLDFHWLVSRPGFPVEHLVEPNTLHLYPTAQLMAALDAAGLQVEQIQPGLMDDSSLLLGRRR